MKTEKPLRVFHTYYERSMLKITIARWLFFSMQAQDPLQSDA
jgi:hypothetical protein